MCEVMVFSSVAPERGVCGRVTKRVLFDAENADMEASGESSIPITKILKGSGVTNGSLYQHFGSREGLVREPIAERFLGSITEGLVVFAERVAKVRTSEEMFALLRQDLVRIGTHEVKMQRTRPRRHPETVTPR
jgi:AcrR family transcriptional regulator